MQAELTDAVRDESADHEDAAWMPGGSVPVASRPRALTKLTSDDESRLLALINKATS